jgi:hypothetical protein
VHTGAGATALKSANKSTVADWVAAGKRRSDFK